MNDNDTLVHRFRRVYEELNPLEKIGYERVDKPGGLCVTWRTSDGKLVEFGDSKGCTTSEVYEKKTDDGVCKIEIHWLTNEFNKTLDGYDYAVSFEENKAVQDLIEERAKEE